MKLLHTADLHLDRSFEGLKKIPNELKKKLLAANHQVLTAIVDCAIREQVDLVILAGDTFHQNRTSIQTQAYFIKEMNRLAQLSIPVAMIFGNHDYYREERYWFDFPENMILFTQEDVVTKYITTKKQEKIALTGFSYTHPWINEHKLKLFPMRDQNASVHIGIYHGDTKQLETQNYAPFSFQEMKEKGYDYWALGHIHQTEVVSTFPAIIYPGTPQGHTIKERSVQGVALVTIEAGQASVDFESVATIHWETVNCSLKQTTTLQLALDVMEQKLLNDKQQEEIICLKALILTETAHLGDEFSRSLESGELLQYLQEKIVAKSQSSTFVFRIEDETQELENKLFIQASSALLEQLQATYIEPEIFTQTMNELFTNPLFTNALVIDHQWRKKSIEKANQKIMNKFIIEEEQQ